MNATSSAPMGPPPSIRAPSAGRDAFSTANLVRETSPIPGVRLAQVDILQFVRRYLPGMGRVQGLAQRPVPLSAFASRPGFLSQAEFAGVGRFRSLKKQVEWICGRLAAKTAVAAAAGVGLDLKYINLAYEKEGAPYVRTLPGLPLSIAHSGAWAVAVAGGRGRIGLDIEPVPARDLGFLLEAGFSRRERLALIGASAETVIRRWTLKEAFLKFIAKGFNESLAAVEILDGRLYYHGCLMENLAVICDPLDGGYVMSLVFAESGD
ncbi:MAG: 4'-phosphopantetheinyl transferase superfamily protein [Desulfobacterales bacterium]|nr:4'-phosphopantetheinyl transferase superfamily protein [Desulfobacterales bacterium]